MPKLITLEDGTVLWDYDLEPEAPKPGSKAALIAEAQALDLDTSGTKAELADRITAAKKGA